MLVKELMTKNPITVDPETSVLQAWSLMQDRQVDTLPVLEEGRLVGVVNDPDLRLALPSPATSLEAHEINYLLDTMPVADLMAKPAATTAPTVPLEEAARILLRPGVQALPVLEDDRLVGILTRFDVLQTFACGPDDALTPAA